MITRIPSKVLYGVAEVLSTRTQENDYRLHLAIEFHQEPPTAWFLKPDVYSFDKDQTRYLIAYSDIELHSGQISHYMKTHRLL